MSNTSGVDVRGFGNKLFICDAIWENLPHGENLTFWVLVLFKRFSSPLSETS